MTTAVHAITRDFLAKADRDDLAETLVNHIAEIFGTAVVVLLEEDGEFVARAGTSALVAAPRDRAVAQGGRLRAENRGDGGATFSLEIPLPMSPPSP